MRKTKVEVDKELLSEVKPIFEKYHLTNTEVFNLFLRRIKTRETLPPGLFDPNIPMSEDAFYLKTLVDILAARCEYIFYVNLDNDHYRQFTMEGGFEATSPDAIGEHFFAESFKNIDIIVFEEDRDRLKKALTKSNMLAEIEDHNIFIVNYRLITSGYPVYYQMRASLSPEDATYMVIEVRNIQKQIEKEAEYKIKIKKAREEARIDTLTGCYNYLAMEEAKTTIDEIIKNKTSDLSIALCDLNDLKIINDTYGHPTGDKYLVESVECIKEFFQSSNIYRIGGDEFIIVIEKEDYPNRYERYEQFKKRIEENMFQDKPVIAIGIVDPNEEFNTAEKLIEEADRLMYINKHYLKEKQGSR